MTKQKLLSIYIFTYYDTKAKISIYVLYNHTFI